MRKGQKMNKLDVEFFDIGENPKLEVIAKTFLATESNKIDSVNWESYPYLPLASFKVFYSQDSFFIKYDIFEQSVLARKQHTNDPVYKDSCVEFFVSPGDGKYYNFEFNAIGTKYGGSSAINGSGGTVDNELIEKIKTYSTLGSDPFEEREEDTVWSLIVQIPLNLFTYKTINELRGSTMGANFYKCGDEMKVPHFVSWNKIISETPNFHTPEYFGEISFK